MNVGGDADVGRCRVRAVAIGQDARVRMPLQTRFVTDPSGKRWRVSVRWLPWHPKTKRIAEDTGYFDVPVLGGFDDELGIGCVIVLIVLAIVVVLPIVLFFFELALLLAVFVVVVLVGGTLGLRRWTIEVEGIEPASGVRRTLAHDRGIGAADASIMSIADAIERGTLDPRTATGKPHG
jgi:hypothetical protein